MPPLFSYFIRKVRKIKLLTACIKTPIGAKIVLITISQFYETIFREKLKEALSFEKSRSVFGHAIFLLIHD